MSLVRIPPAPRISLVDRNGNITRPWSELIDAIVRRIGGPGEDPTNGDLADSINAIEQEPQPAFVLPDHDHLLPAQRLDVPSTDESGRVQALEAEVARLRTEIEALQQGYQL